MEEPIHAVLRTMLLITQVTNPTRWSSTETRFLVTWLFTLVAIFVVLKWVNVSTKLPPGPRPLPLIGNLHQLDDIHLIYQNLWHLEEKHGEIMYLRLGTRPLLVDLDAEATEVFHKVQDMERRGQLFYVAHKIFENQHLNFGIRPSQVGSTWRCARKIMMAHLIKKNRLECFKWARIEEIGQMMRSVYEESVLIEYACDFESEG